LNLCRKNSNIYRALTKIQKAQQSSNETTRFLQVLEVTNFFKLVKTF
jgi:hypothetical protein